MSENQSLAIAATKTYQQKNLSNQDPWWDELVTVKAGTAEEYNRAMEAADSRWLLFLHDGEIISPKLQEAIRDFVSKADQKGYTGAYLIEQLSFLGHLTQFGHFGKKKVLTLGRRVGRWQKQKDQPVWDFPGRKYIIKTPLYYQPYQDVTDALEKINQESKITAKRMAEGNRRGHIIKIIFLPAFIFCRDYFCQLGILDGFPGFSLAVLDSFQQFLTQAKLWLRQQEEVSNKQ